MNLDNDYKTKELNKKWVLILLLKLDIMVGVEYLI
jgi:hypothetical protein